MSRVSVLALATAAACGLAPRIAAQQTPPAASATRADSTRMSVVTYISGRSVYVGAGRADGVREGTLLEVLRARAVIATVRVAFLASHSASGEIDSSTATRATSLPGCCSFRKHLNSDHSLNLR